MKPIQKVLERVLASHEPFPAWVASRGFRFIAQPELPVVCPRLLIDGQRVRTISTVMRFDTAIEVTASELRVELMFPADEESEHFFHALAATTARKQ